MISCVFDRILDSGLYEFSSKDNHYESIFEFIGLDKVNIRDKILIHEDLLDKGSKYYTQPYTFEIVNIDPKEIKEKNNTEYIVIQIKNKNYSLKRIYG